MFRICAILMFVCALRSGAQDPDDGAQQQALQAEARRGQAQFQQTCGFCHGKDGRGASGPDLIRSELVNRDVNGDAIGPIIRNGRPDKGMPAFQLSDEQIREISAFLHAAASDASSVARKLPAEYPVEKLLVGNVHDGQQYFEARCKGCHSTTGDLAHIATKYKPFDLQTRIAFPSGVKPNLTVVDKAGVSYRGEQTYADEFVICLRDVKGWTHTWSRHDVTIKVEDPLAEHEHLLQSYSDKNIHDLFAYLETVK